MRMNFCIFLIFSAAFSKAQNKLVDSTIVVNFDVLQNSVCGIDFYSQSSERIYGVQHDSIIGPSIWYFDLARNIIKVESFNQGKIVNTVFAQKKSDSEMIYIFPTDDMPCGSSNVECRYNKQGLLTEKKVYFYKRIWIFFKRKKISFWHRYYYCYGFYGW